MDFLTNLLLFMSALLGFNTTESKTKPHQDNYGTNLDMIRKIACRDGVSVDTSYGTGFLVAKDTMITAGHVVNKQCIDVLTQTVLTPVVIDHEHDFAILYVPTHGSAHYLPYSCSGFVKNHQYLAFGYAEGTRFQMTRLSATKEKSQKGYMINDTPSSGLVFLLGSIYHGMSGGPIFDENQIVVGISSATDEHSMGLSRELRDTVLCKR